MLDFFRRTHPWDEPDVWWSLRMFLTCVCLGAIVVALIAVVGCQPPQPLDESDGEPPPALEIVSLSGTATAELKLYGAPLFVKTEHVGLNLETGEVRDVDQDGELGEGWAYCHVLNLDVDLRGLIALRLQAHGATHEPASVCAREFGAPTVVVNGMPLDVGAVFLSEPGPAPPAAE